jgi:uncharacterized Zn-finger protein
MDSSTHAATVQVTAKDLQGPGAVVCPNQHMPVWSNHPRVFLDVASTGQAKCPYCGTVYALAPGVKVHGH